MNNILIVAIVTMMVCIVVNLIGLFYKINEIKEIEIELKKLEEDFDIMKQNYMELKKFKKDFDIIRQYYMDGYFDVLLKIHGDDGK